MQISAKKCVEDGDLDGALKQLKATIRDDPSSAKERTFLFQLYCVLGDWDRAFTQLSIAGDLDSDALLMVQTYRELLQCEMFRERVFAGDKLPLVMGKPPAWLGLLLRALSLSAANDGTHARKLCDEAFEQAGGCAGTIDGQPFEWLADGDMRIGPVVEAVIDGKYYWVPIDAIAEIKLSKPEDLRDLVWLPAQFKWSNDGASVGFVPVRYPGQKSVATDQHALARRTDWTDIGGEYFIGSGQKTFTSDTEEHPLLETRIIQFAGPAL
ncbi:MAG: type VI secretion system accessory protein TagJ [Granulosicoccus sp.]